MPALVNASSKASVEFDITRPLRLSRSVTKTAPLDGSPVAYIYSRAVDDHNDIRVAVVSIANICGLSDEQERALVERVADEIVAPSFSEDEIEDIVFAAHMADVKQENAAQCKERIRKTCDDITARRRLNLSGAR